MLRYMTSGPQHWRARSIAVGIGILIVGLLIFLVLWQVGGVILLGAVSAILGGSQ